MPRLSIVVPTVHPWPRMRLLLEQLREQAVRSDAEVVVADGSGAALPPEWCVAPIVHVPVRDGDVFALRAAGWAAARGDIVSMIEDHILVPDDWCARILRAFDEHPDADGIVGTVDNGAPALLDRASFYVTWAPFLAPLASVPTGRCPPPGVVAFRRRVLPEGDVAQGVLEYDLPVRLRAEGRLRAVEHLTVTHIQYLGARAFPIQYHAGRAFGAAECNGVGLAQRLRRLRVLGRNPERLLRQTFGAFRRRPTIHESVAVKAAIVGMIACNGAGQVVGGLTGSPGTSQRYLE